MRNSVGFKLLMAITVLLSSDANNRLALADARCCAPNPTKWKHYVGLRAEFDLPPGWRVLTDASGWFEITEIEGPPQSSMTFGVQQPTPNYVYKNFSTDVAAIVAGLRQARRVGNVRNLLIGNTPAVRVVQRPDTMPLFALVETYLKVPDERLAPEGRGYMYIFNLVVEKNDKRRVELVATYDRVLKSLRVRTPPDNSDDADRFKGRKLEH